MRKINRQNSRLAQIKTFIGVHFFMRETGTDLDLKTKVCPSFMLNFSFFASGVWEVPGFICTAHRGLNRHAKRELQSMSYVNSF